ncbi:MAG: HD domain-containing protein [Alphaproteobacteria bacterium]|nr:HD domain-containing protein [Alphaproteobacteria bacterium]
MSQAFRERLLEILQLKELPRAGWVRAGVVEPESVAAHSWGVAWLVLALCPPELDRGRALAIAVLHDLAEVRVGDITPHDNIPKAEKQRREAEAMAALMAPIPTGGELMDLWNAYGQDAEGRFVKACDKLELALQAARYSRDQGTDPTEFIDAALAMLPPGVFQELAGG